jgi:galactokinase
MTGPSPLTGPPPMAASAGPVAQWFSEQFGSEPAGVWRAPGRANLIGEHTDYNDGFVLPFALDKSTVAAAAPGLAGLLEVCSRQAGPGVVAIPLDGLSPGTVTGWAAYPAGVAWALGQAGYPVSGARLAIDSDVPQGAGLSSSAALDCAVALALTELAGRAVPRPELAAIARRAENDFVGVPTGIMDQSAALLCQAGHALLLDCRSGESDNVPLDPAAHRLALLIIDTRARHELTESGYAVRFAECAAAARELGVGSLRDIPDAAGLAGLADQVLLRRARHVVTENQRVLAAADLLRRGNVADVGPLLIESHVSLRDDFEVSWPQADVAVAAAAEAGALGARMMGGGFGGSVIALVPAALVPAEPDPVDPAAAVSAAVRGAVRRAFSRQGWPAPGFLHAPPSPSAQRLR